MNRPCRTDRDKLELYANIRDMLPLQEKNGNEDTSCRGGSVDVGLILMRGILDGLFYARDELLFCLYYAIRPLPGRTVSAHWLPSPLSNYESDQDDENRRAGGEECDNRDDSVL